MSPDFEKLAQRHKDAVYRQLYRMCGNREDAEDVLVESLVKAHRAIAGLESEEAFKAWLAQIARRTCGRLKKRESMRPLLSMASLEGSRYEPTAEANAEEQMEESELKSCILRAFESLPPKVREVYRLRDVEGVPAEETGKRLGISVAAVKSRLHRARAMIRERIDRALTN